MIVAGNFDMVSCYGERSDVRGVVKGERGREDTR